VRPARRSTVHEKEAYDAQTVDDSDLTDLVPWKAPPAPTASEPQFWANVERWEAESWNAPGTEKAWVERLLVRWKPPIGEAVCERPAATGRARLFQSLHAFQVRYLVIGVSGADLHAKQIQARFQTKDLDLFLPLDAENLLACWRACEAAGLTLWCNREPLDTPRDLWLARRAVSTRSLTTAQGADIEPTDLTLVMGSLDFEDVWLRRGPGTLDREFVDVARMSDIVASKREANRPKDVSFLTQHREVIERILANEGPPDMLP